MPDEISKDIEPAANTWWMAREPRTEAEGVALSIAISLKRIADEICGVPYDYAPGADNSKHSAGITAGIQLAIEQGISAASQRG